MTLLENIDRLTEANRKETVVQSMGSIVLASRLPAFRKTGKEWLIKVSGIYVMHWSKKRDAIRAWNVLKPQAGEINYVGAIKALTKARLYR
jgi:hypothetical protein